MRLATAAVGAAEDCEVADSRDGAQDEGDGDTNLRCDAESGQVELCAQALVTGVRGETAAHVPFRVIHLVQHNGQERRLLCIFLSRVLRSSCLTGILKQKNV